MKVLLCVVLLAFSLADVKHPFKLVDPSGPPPHFDAVDYARYAQPGTGTVVAQMATLLKTGGAIFVTHGEAVYLYPLTPYTNWLISRWANAEVSGRPWNVQPTYPGQRFHNDPHPSQFDVPSILIPPLFRGDPPTAVRKAYVERDERFSGIVTFRSVPAGEYVIVARTTQEYVVGDSASNPIVYELGPDGMMEPDPASIGTHYEEHTVVAGGYLVVNRASVVDGKTTYVSPATCNVVAYYP